MLLVMLSVSCASAAAEDYEIKFHAKLETHGKTIAASIAVKQSRHALRQLNFRAPKERYRRFEGDGLIERQGDRLVWQIPEQGGKLSYRFVVPRKKAGSWDAQKTDRWVLFRLGHLFPAAKAKVDESVEGHFSLSMQAPDIWALESRYGSLREAREIPAEGRKYQRPTGWFIGGELGVRRDQIGQHLVTVAAPKGGGYRRLDTLAFLRFTLPHLVKVLPQLGEKILIVGAPEEMWRGGLSAPDSLYLQQNLPMISENGTSVLLHELVHLAGFTNAADGADWIVEGIAEFYSLEFNRRAGGLSNERFDAAMQNLKRWVNEDEGRLADPSTGVNTMAAVLLFYGLDKHLQSQGHSLDSVVRKLLSFSKISEQGLLQATETVLGKPSEWLRTHISAGAQPNLP